MSSATALPAEADAYLAAVRGALADLPASERDDLLAELEVSLLESAGEGGSPTARLGPPEEFAAELRAAAGLHAPPAPAVRESALVRLARRVRVWAAQEPRPLALRRARELAPIWWALRGYLLVGLIALATGASWSTAMPLVPRLDSAGLGLAAIAVAAAASIWLGFRLRASAAPTRRLAVAANVLLLAGAIPVAQKIDDTARTVVVPEINVVAEPTPGLALDGDPITNVYPFTRGGRLLHDVLLFDGQGRPLPLAAAFDDPNRRVLRTPLGKPLFNSFPIRYFEPGTRIVAHPDAAPRVEIPPIVTPPLKRLR